MRIGWSTDLQRFRGRFFFSFDAAKDNKESKDKKKKDFRTNISLHYFNQMLKGGILRDELFQDE